MHRALYRTWRPQTFDDVSGQLHVTEILKYQVQEQKTSHAYLFCGSRGTGKTTCAKILAKAVNCLHPVNGNPCNECEACKMIDLGLTTDVVEMDAASNNGVDQVRDLKDEIAFMPTALKYKVYIIDEVHMMSASAFNALLKTLEEPPTYILFILATTELQKLPQTIISRCQRCDFRRISTKDIIARLYTISKKEGFDLQDSGAMMIARAAQGGMRDAVSLLELCSSSKAKIDEELVSRTLGIGSSIASYQIAESILARDLDTLYKTIDSIALSSGDFSSFFTSLNDVFRNVMIKKTVKDPSSFLDTTDEESRILETLSKNMTLEQLYFYCEQVDEALMKLQRAGNNPRMTAELTLTKMVDVRLDPSIDSLLARIAKLETELAKIQSGISVIEPPKKEPKKKKEVSPLAKEEPTPIESIEQAPKETKPEEESVKKVLKNWKTAIQDFGTACPQFGMLFGLSRGFAVDSHILEIQVQDHLLLKNFEMNQKFQQLLLSIVNRDLENLVLDEIKLVRVGVKELQVPLGEEDF